jgi:hypothetical protein
MGIKKTADDFAYCDQSTVSFSFLLNFKNLSAASPQGITALAVQGENPLDGTK